MTQRIERYLRHTFTVAGAPDHCEIIVGVELPAGADIARDRAALREGITMSIAVENVDPDEWTMDEWLAVMVETAIRRAFPDRAYFLEVCHDDPNGWIQVYWPSDIPKVRLHAASPAPRPAISVGRGPATEGEVITVDPSRYFEPTS